MNKFLSLIVIFMTSIASDARQFSPELLWKIGRIGSFDAYKKDLVYNVSYYDVESNKSQTIIKLNGKKLTKEGKSEQSPLYHALQ